MEFGQPHRDGDAAARLLDVSELDRVNGSLHTLRVGERRGGAVRPQAFEEEFRQAMRAVAGSGRALEMNVGGHLRPWIVQWWREEGGKAVTFGSDAHQPPALANNFPEAVAMVEYHGFRPGRRPEHFWTR